MRVLVSNASWMWVEGEVKYKTLKRGIPRIYINKRTIFFAVKPSPISSSTGTKFKHKQLFQMNEQPKWDASIGSS